MNTLKALRADLGAALGSDVTVLDHLPERLPTPATFIAAGSPYIESGDTFGSYKVRFTLIMVCGKGTNEVETEALDVEVARTVVALNTAGWALERVDQPVMLAHGNANYLSTTVDVVRVVRGIDDGGS